MRQGLIHHASAGAVVASDMPGPLWPCTGSGATCQMWDHVLVLVLCSGLDPTCQVLLQISPPCYPDLAYGWGGGFPLSRNLAVAGGGEAVPVLIAVAPSAVTINARTTLAPSLPS